LVVKGDQVLLAEGFGFADRENNVLNTADTVFSLASVTKQFTAVAAMILHDQEKLDIDATVDTYLPDYPEGNKFTVRQLLNHSSGLPNFWDHVDAINFQQPATLDELISTFRNQPLAYEPGSTFIYNNAGYYLAGKIIEEVSGREYGDFLKEHILQPLGMQNTYFGAAELPLNTATGYIGRSIPENVIDATIPHAAGGIKSSVNDMFKWQQALLGKKLLSEESWREVTTDYGYGYGLGWSITALSDEALLEHNGSLPGFSTFIWLRPTSQMAIVMLSNDEYFQPDVYTTKIIILSNQY
jgi:CubicO group peptidase (beta-lactamase class C family)